LRHFLNRMLSHPSKQQSYKNFRAFRGQKMGYGRGLIKTICFIRSDGRGKPASCRRAAGAPYRLRLKK
jgi:hypothetical protein